jgi:hypothetical protein
VVEDQAAGELAVAEQVVAEPAAQALRAAAGAVGPACGILVCPVARVAVVAQGQARVAQVVEVGLEAEVVPAAEVELDLDRAEVASGEAVDLVEAALAAGEAVDLVEAALAAGVVPEE